MNFPDWGNVPAWISTGSFFIAAIAYQRSVLDKQRDQASKVSAWIGTVAEDGKSKRVLRITNTSDAAVYDLYVKPDGSDPVFLPEVPAKTSKTLDLQGDPPAVKGRSVGAGISFVGVKIEVRSESFQVSLEPLPVLEFCDAVGRWWRRSSRRKVQRIRRRTIETVTKKVTNYNLFGVEVDGTIIRATPFPRRSPKSSPPREPE